MNNYSLPETVEISADILFQEIDGESVLLNLKTEQYFGLNEVGTRYWQLVSESGNTENALKGVLREYEVLEETLRGDLAILTQDLIQNGFVNNS